jgi:nicotinamidase-related amidase
LKEVFMSSAEKRALLVIDVQNEYVGGALPIEYPDVSRSLETIGRAMDAARAASIPIVVVQQTGPPDAPAFAKGTAGWELHPVVARRYRDHYLEKRLPSAFAGTDLADWIAAHHVETLTVCGYMTHNCVDSTVKHALHAGLAVEVLQDATGSLPYSNRAGAATAEEIHRAFLVVVQSRFAAVLSTDEWIDAVRTGTPTVRETIIASYRRAHRSAAATAFSVVS